MDTYRLSSKGVVDSVIKTVACEPEQNRKKREQQQKNQSKKRENMPSLEEEEQTITAKKFESYDAYARKVTVYPFRSDGFEV